MSFKSTILTQFSGTAALFISMKRTNAKPTYANSNTHTYMCVYIHMYVYINEHIHMYVYINEHIHMYVYIHIHICIYIYAYKCA